MLALNTTLFRVQVYVVAFENSIYETFKQNCATEGICVEFLCLLSSLT